MITQTINRKIELFEILYRECRRDPDVVAMIVDEYLNAIDDSKLTELEDFVANNFAID